MGHVTHHAGCDCHEARWQAVVNGLRAEIALMREEIESQERAHAEELERWRKLYEYQQRAHAPEVSRWRAAALQYAARLARLGQKVTMPDAPAALDELAQAAQDDGQYDPPVQN